VPYILVVLKKHNEMYFHDTRQITTEQSVATTSVRTKQVVCVKPTNFSLVNTKVVTV
jgi:hypothetical protein